MPVGQPRNYYKKFKFTVEIDGMTYAGFSTMSELKQSVGVVEHREGGTLLADKTPGLVTTENVTLERGATQDRELWLWWRQVVRTSNAQGTSLAASGFSRPGALVQQDMDGAELMRWNMTGLWPVSFSAGEWDNSAEEVLIHAVELSVENFEPVEVSNA